MGRRRRRVVRIVKKKLPTVFVCPRCGEEAVRVTIAKDTGHATVLCALCNLRDEFPAHPAAQAIDVYSYFTDRFYGVKDPRPIIPHDRDFQIRPPEEETGEDESTVATMENAEKIPEPSVQEPASQPDEPSEPSLEQGQVEPSPTVTSDSAQSPPEEASSQSESESREESEPFADILENKDKKRYSSTPLPQQSSESTS